MSSIFVKVVDEAVSKKWLSVKLAKGKPIEIKGISAEKIVKNIEKLLNGKDSFNLIAGKKIFNDDLVLMEEIFDIFEDQNINDSAYYYKIWKNSSEDYSFEIYCQSGNSIKIKKKSFELIRNLAILRGFFILDFY